MVDGGVARFGGDDRARAPGICTSPNALTGIAPRRHRHQRAPSSAGECACDRATWWVGDGSGVVSIPAERALEVAELAQRHARDDEAAAELRKALTFSAAMAKFERICKSRSGRTSRQRARFGVRGGEGGIDNSSGSQSH